MSNTFMFKLYFSFIGFRECGCPSYHFIFLEVINYSSYDYWCLYFPGRWHVFLNRKFMSTLSQESILLSLLIFTWFFPIIFFREFSYVYAIDLFILPIFNLCFFPLHLVWFHQAVLYVQVLVLSCSVMSDSLWPYEL